MTKHSQKTQDKYNQVMIEEFKGSYLTNFSMNGVSHWYRINFKFNREDFTNPLKMRQNYLSSITSWILFIVAIIISIEASLLFADYNGADFVLRFFTSIDLALIVIFLAGIITGLTKRQKRYPLLSSEKELRMSYSSWHIVSIMDSIAEPEIIDGVYSIPSSMVLGYRIREHFHTEEYYDTTSVGFSLDLILKNRKTIKIASKNIRTTLKKRLQKATDGSLQSIGLKSSRILSDESNGWTIRGIPDDVPLDKVLKVHKTRNSSLLEIKYSGPVEKSPQFDIRLKVPCNYCQKAMNPRSLIYDGQREKSSLTCRSCMKKHFKKRIKQHNDKIKSLETNTGKLNSFLSKINVIGRPLIVTEIIFYSFFVVLILLLSFVLMQAIMWIVLFVIATIGWLGYLNVTIPDTKRSIQQIIGIGTGIEPTAEEYFKTDLGIDTPINKLDVTTRKAVIKSGLFLGFLELVIIFVSLIPVYSGILTDAMSLNAVIFLVIIQVVPLMVIYVSLVVGSISVMINDIQLNDLNYYLPPQVRMT